MKSINRFFFLFLFANTISAQSMLDMNAPLDVKKARIKKCVEVEDGKDLWTMYYDTNGRQLKNTFFASKLDTTGNFIYGYYGVKNFVYDLFGNLIEVNLNAPTSSISPYMITKYTYDNSGNILKEELNHIIHKLHKEIDTDKVITQYYYSDSRLIKEKFKSSFHFVETMYSYEDSNRLNLITRVEDNNTEITKINYVGDTIFYRKFDRNTVEFYNMYRLKNNMDKIKELFIWDKLNNRKFKITYFFDEFGILQKKETYSFITNKRIDTFFRYEKY